MHPDPDHNDPELEPAPEPAAPTRRLAYALVNDQDVIVGLTVLDVPEDDFDAEQARLDAAHADPAHRKIDASIDLPSIGDQIGAA